MTTTTPTEALVLAYLRAARGDYRAAVAMADATATDSARQVAAYLRAWAWDAGHHTA